MVLALIVLLVQYLSQRNGRTPKVRQEVFFKITALKSAKQPKRMSFGMWWKSCCRGWWLQMQSQSRQRSALSTASPKLIQEVLWILNYLRSPCALLEIQSTLVALLLVTLKPNFHTKAAQLLASSILSSVIWSCLQSPFSYFIMPLNSGGISEVINWR